MDALFLGLAGSLPWRQDEEASPQPVRSEPPLVGFEIHSLWEAVLQEREHHSHPCALPFSTHLTFCFLCLQVAGDAHSLSEDKQAESEEEEEGRAPNSPGNPMGGHTSPLPPSQDHGITLLLGKMLPNPLVRRADAACAKGESQGGVDSFLVIISLLFSACFRATFCPLGGCLVAPASHMLSWVSRTNPCGPHGGPRRGAAPSRAILAETG